VNPDEPAPLTPTAVGRSSLVLILSIGAAQAVGIVRELYLAAQVGLTGSLDAVLIALLLPTLIAGIAAGGAGGALIPVYLEARSTIGREDARRLAGTVAAWISLVGIALAGIILVLAPVLITISGPGLSQVDHDSATGYLRLLAPVVLFTVISTMMRIVCQAEGRFGSMALGFVAGPLATLATMLALWERLHLGALVVGTIVGSSATLAVFTVAAARAGALPIPGLRADPRLRAWLRHAAPLTLSGGILEIRGVVDRAIASLLGPGSVSALRYALVLLQPLVQIGPAWASVIYPRLVQSTLGSAGGSLAEWAQRMLRQAIAIFVPIAVLIVAVAPLAVSVAYGRGEFTTQDLALTAGVLAGYAPIVVTFMMLPVLVGSHNARRRGRLMLAGGALNMALGVALSITLGRVLGAAGIALANAISEIVVVVMFLIVLARSKDGFSLVPLARTGVLAAVAVAPFALVAAALAWPMPEQDFIINAATLIGVGVVGGVGYLAAAAVLGIPEVGGAVRAALELVPRVGRSRS